MGLVAERLNLRLFIDGVEVPVIGAKCTFSEGTVATAEIQLIATDELYDIEPRAFVTLFVYDNYDYVPTPGGSSTRIGPHDLRRWKLLFAGEYVAVGLQKSAGSRQATISCACPTNYLDFIRQQYINFRNGGVELFEAAFMGVKQDRLKFFDVVTQGVNSKLYVWLTQSRNANGEPSLYLGVQRMLREMFFSVNDFYAEAFNRLRIGDTIVGLAEDETAAKLFNLQFFEKFIKNKVGGAGGMVTARQLIDLLLGPVFHTYVTVPFPRFDRTGASAGVQLNPNNAADIPLLDGIIGRENAWPGAALHYTVIKPDTWFMAPPACNVVFPHQYNSLSYQRNFLAEPTRLFLRTSLIFTENDSWLTERFYAPDFEAFNQLLYQKGGYLDRMATTLLPHEEFIGLNPAQVWQADLAAYVQKGPRREYFGKLADYLYWKYRFGTRSVNVSGPLNMNLLPGYPGLVMDRMDSDAGVTRHYMGSITTVMHSVDQNGGWTSFSMAGARTHDEVADFDGAGRTLEEITSRGTDGFLDDRYDVTTIGDSVYQPLFGCPSLYDIGLDLTDLADLDGISKTPVVSSVRALETTYRTVLGSSSDIRVFTDSITQRPKANFAEMMGLLLARIQSEFVSQEAFSYATETDPELLQNPEGFFSSAISTVSQTVENATYTSANGTKGQYALKAHMEARQDKVLAYADSLRLRGLRG